MTDLPELSDVVDELLARQPETDMVPTLDRVARVMGLLGDPQHSPQIVHITGTNGKTSCARMVESMVRRAGLRTGLFTSPHLFSITERIQVDGAPLSPEAFVTAYEDLRPLLDIVDNDEEEAGRPPLTFFEVLTAIAYWVFADAPVDVAVVEVGLGGRWDATNVGDGRVCVITPIDVDHTEWLGETPVGIAMEKAGIIKPGALQVVVAEQSDEVMAVLTGRCRETGVPDAVAGRDFELVERSVAVGGQVLTIRGMSGRYEQVFLPLMGAHQAANATLAVAAVESLLIEGAALDLAVVDALGGVMSPGRLDAVAREPTVLVDAAHNPAGARALAAAVAESYAFSHLIVVVAIMADKDIPAILEALAPAADLLIATQNSSPRSARADHVGSVAAELLGESRVRVVADLAGAIAVARELADEPGAGVLVTGSVVTAAEAMTIVTGRVGDDGA